MLKEKQRNKTPNYEMPDTELSEARHQIVRSKTPNCQKQDTNTRWVSNSFVEIDHEIFPTVVLSFQLIQEGQ